MGLIEQIMLLLFAVGAAFFAGKGFKWNIKRKATKEVHDELEDDRVNEYIEAKERLNARDPITTVDDARERLRRRD